jgi:hypothetical protein
MTQEQSTSTAESKPLERTAAQVTMGGLPLDETATRAAFDRLFNAAPDTRAQQANLLESTMKTTPADQQPPAQPGKSLKGTADYDKAVKALELDGIPKALLESWPEEKIVEIGLHRSKVHADVDSKLNGAKPKTEEKAQSQEQTDAKALGLTDAAKALYEEVGEDTGKLLTGYLEQAIRAEGAKLIEQFQSALMSLHMERLQEKLGVESSTWGKVVEQMGVLSETGRYSDLDSLARDAMKLVGHAPQPSRDSRATASPEVPSARARPQPLTLEEREKAAFFELLNSRDVDTAKRTFQRTS